MDNIIIHQSIVKEYLSKLDPARNNNLIIIHKQGVGK
jgi:hypothetical protein